MYEYTVILLAHSLKTTGEKMLCDLREKGGLKGKNGTKIDFKQITV